MINVYEFAEKKINNQASQTNTTNYTVVLDFDSRTKSRLRTQAECGTQIGFFLPRGTILQDGDQLKAEHGQTICIVAAQEQVSQINNNDTLLLTKAAYHLGNRHVPLQIGEGWLRYQSDHVLDDMVVQMGLEITTQKQAFQPESGAYSNSNSHSNGHSQSKEHDHSHEHSHEHNHCHD